MANAVAKRKQVDPADLSGREKAAILCLALGAETAAIITQKLTPEEAEVISFEIARLDNVSTEVVDAVLHHWLEAAALDSLSSGGVEYARDILEHGEEGEEAVDAGNEDEADVAVAPSSAPSPAAPAPPSSGAPSLGIGGLKGRER